jgi:acetyl-CoA carboxylase biotin carboxyl carrier protein
MGILLETQVERMAMALTPEDIKALVATFDASDWGEMSVRIGDTTLELTRTGRPPEVSADHNSGSAVAQSIAPPVLATPAPQATAAATPASVVETHSTPSQPAAAGSTPDGHTVKAPSLGLFWRSPQPGAPEFVVIGQEVDAEDTVGIVEVMKLMNHVKAGVSGTVVAIEPDNGQMVEFGQLLVVIRPHG